MCRCICCHVSFEVICVCGGFVVEACCTTWTRPVPSALASANEQRNGNSNGNGNGSRSSSTPQPPPSSRTSLNTAGPLPCHFKCLRALQSPTDATRRFPRSQSFLRNSQHYLCTSALSRVHSRIVLASAEAERVQIVICCSHVDAKISSCIQEKGYEKQRVDCLIVADPLALEHPHVLVRLPARQHSPEYHLGLIRTPLKFPVLAVSTSWRPKCAPK